MRASCCEESAACGGDTACQRLSFCRAGCVTLSCFESCWVDHLVGNHLADPLQECAKNYCMSECGMGRNWSCVPAAWPQSSSLTLELTFKLYVGTDQVGVPGIPVRACELTNDPCLDPIAQGITNENGIVVYDLEANNAGGFFRGFNQYLDMDVVGTDYMPILHQLSPPVTSPHTQQLAPMIKKADFAALLGGPGAVDPERGHVVFTVHDCSGSYAPDLQFSVEGSNDGVIPVYFTSLASIGAEATTSLGIAGLINVKPPSVTVVGTVRQTGQVVGKLRLLVRAGTVTSSDFYPSPL